MLDKRLPTSLNVENHSCGWQVGYIVLGEEKRFYDLDTKEPITLCPECEEPLSEYFGSRFHVGERHDSQV